MSERPMKIAVMALGGQGGGVLASWLVTAGERAGFIAQSTSVPGVAQRTGATIYYVELFPEAAAARAGKAPVLALMPAPGDVDIVIAAELMEAGRALARGLLSRQTALIASTHRVYAVSEKIAPGDGRHDSDAVRAAAAAAAGRSLFFDMERLAGEAGAAISAVLLGAVAGSGATPVPRAAFEAAIREGGRAVEANLRGFALGYEAAAGGSAPPADARPAAAAASGAAPDARPLIERAGTLPAGAREVAILGLKRVIEFQDRRHGALYLERLSKMADLDDRAGGAGRGHALTKAVAAGLALAMSYEDVIRVADLKTRPGRRERVLKDVRAAEGQIVRVFEYMHPRLEEFCDLLPPRLAAPLLRSRVARRLFDLVAGGGRRVETTGVAGFLMLRLLASLRPLRRASSRFSAEEARIAAWLGLVENAARRDYALAVEIAGLQRLIKGYGDTHARGLAKFRRIVDALDRVESGPEPAARLRRLRDAALHDEEGAALARELAALGVEAAPAAA